MATEKFYIVYFNSITQFDITNKGYYVGYKDKLEDNYSDNFVFAKRYKSLKGALNRLHLPCEGAFAKELVDMIDSGQKYMPNYGFIEVVRIDNLRKRKLRSLKGQSSDPIRNLGLIPKEEFREFLMKEVNKMEKATKHLKDYNTKTATDEDIDDFCSHMDNLK